jgi:hypothetical protein
VGWERSEIVVLLRLGLATPGNPERQPKHDAGLLHPFLRRNRCRHGSFVSQQQREQGEFPMADDRDDVERERTTVVETGGGGGGGILAVVLLIIVVLVLLYIFRGQLGLGGHTTNINVPNSIDVNVNH